MTRRRKVLVAVPVVIVTVMATAAAALVIVNLPGRGRAQNPLYHRWDTAVAPISTDSGSQGDPLKFGMAPTRGDDVGMTSASFQGTRLIATSEQWSAGYLFTLEAKTKPATGTSYLLQKVVLVDRSAADGTTPFTATELEAFIDGTQCGLDIKTNQTWRIGIRHKTDAPSAETVYSYDIRLEFVDGPSHSSSSCNPWPAL